MVSHYQPRAMIFVLALHNLITLISDCMIYLHFLIYLITLGSPVGITVCKVDLKNIDYLDITVACKSHRIAQGLSRLLANW